MTTIEENILVVDDKPDNLRLLSAILSDHGYTVRKSLNGKMALNTIHQVLPDLILLDINMPDLNGYQVCEILKAAEETQEIPIIFISALDDVLDKVKAFKIGGVDYITKPFQGEEVIARIENQLIIQRQRKQLKAEIENRKKAEESLQIYLHAVSHDLRNPVLGLSMVLNNLLKKAASQSEIMIAKSVLERMVESCDRQLNLINSLVETQQFETGGISLACQPLNLVDFINTFIQDWQLFFQKNQTKVITEFPTKLPFVLADKYQLMRVLENLVTNAIKHNDSHLTLTFQVETLNESQVCCRIYDNGCGIDPNLCKTLFDRYQRGKEARKILGLGLGLYLCRLIIEAHHGEIGVNSQLNEGTAFWFTLKRVTLTDC
jgi:two-component system sensor histidine kinase/response regulator